MGDGLAVTDRIRALIGQVSDPIIMEVEAGAIKRFCHAVGDANPLYTDPEYAKHGPYGSVICPPGFFGLPVKQAERGPLSGLGVQLIKAFAEAGFPGVLNAGTEYEIYVPVYPGDVIVASSKVAEVNERKGRSGVMLFAIIETAYINQHGDVVAKTRMQMVGRP